MVASVRLSVCLFDCMHTPLCDIHLFNLGKGFWGHFYPAALKRVIFFNRSELFDIVGGLTAYNLVI